MPPRASAVRASFHGWPLWLAWTTLVTSIVVAARVVTARTGGPFIYALDDAYIHMAMAANLARHAVWGCTPFHYSAASSSPLWTALLGLAFTAFGVHDLLPLVLNVLLLAGTLAVCDAYLRQMGAAPFLRATALMALIAAVPMPAMALLGMEHSLHLLLSIAFMVSALDEIVVEAPDARRIQVACRSPLLGALLAASRYEGLFLVAVVAGVQALCGRWRRGAALVLAAALPVTVIGAVAVASGSYFLPNSLALKAANDGSTFGALMAPFGAADLASLMRHPVLAWLAAGSALVAGVEFARWRQFRRLSVVMPAALLLLIALHVHFTLSSPFWVYRYDAYLLGLGVFITAAVAATTWRSSLPGAMAVLLCAATTGTLPTGLWPAVEIEAAAVTYREHYTAAEFVRTIHPGETVVVNDVGAMAYVAGGHVLDMFGLCDVEPVVLRRAGHYNRDGVLAWTAPERPSLAIVQLSWGWVIDHIPETWRKVAEVELQPEGRVLGFYSTSDDAAAALRLRADVTQFYGAGHRSGYRVRGF